MKRKNPTTNEPFKKGDLREDGYSFVRYKTEYPVKRDGKFLEIWKKPQNKEKGIKRINTTTGKPFKRGDFDTETKKYFWGWDSNGSDVNGFRYEIWCSSENFERNRINSLKSSKRNKEKNKIKAKSGVHKRRLNPKTGEYFKRGEKDESGRYFLTYARNSKSNGFIGEEWGDYNRFLRQQISSTINHAKKRAEEKNLNFTITSEYMMSIYPKNEICPILGIKMEWLGNSENSPSIDRIVPSLGYVEENVAWISKKANTLKLDRSPDILRKLADWIDKEMNKVES